MPQRKGEKLYVNLGASQTRRRLKGVGHGVRKVESAGSNRSLIIHTARGRSLAELQALFADVGFSTSDTEPRSVEDHEKPVDEDHNGLRSE